MRNTFLLDCFPHPGRQLRPITHARRIAMGISNRADIIKSESHPCRLIVAKVAEAKGMVQSKCNMLILPCFTTDTYRILHREGGELYVFFGDG